MIMSVLIFSCRDDGPLISVDIKSMDFMLIVNNINTVPLVSQPHIRMHMLIRVKSKLPVAVIVEWFYCLQLVYIMTGVGARAFNIILVMGCLLNERPQIIIHDASLVFVADKTHWVRQLYDVVFEFDKLLAFLHVNKKLLLVIALTTSVISFVLDSVK